MRLSQSYVEIIRQAAHDVFGPDAVVRLFGSRVDDAKRGGDVDLHVELPHGFEGDPERWKFVSDVQERADDERRIDVVIHHAGQPLRWIDDVALRDGIVL
jgi:predicted nucleotidyltransferase